MGNDLSIPTATIQKQQQRHTSKWRPWERRKNNGNIVPQLNARHGRAESARQWAVRLLCLYPAAPLSSIFSLTLTTGRSLSAFFSNTHGCGEETMEGCFCSRLLTNENRCHQASSHSTSCGKWRLYVLWQTTSHCLTATCVDNNLAGTTRAEVVRSSGSTRVRRFNYTQLLSLADWNSRSSGRRF